MKPFVLYSSHDNIRSYAQGEGDEDMGCSVTIVSHKIEVVDGKRTVVKVPTYWSFVVALGGTDSTQFRYVPAGGEELSEETVDRLVAERLP